MTLEYTSYVLPFIVSTVILIFLSVYSFRLKERVETARVFSLLTFSLATWTFCYAMELSSVSLENKILWAQLKYLGSAPAAILWFVFSLHFTNHKSWLTTPLKIVMGIYVVLTIGIVFTNELHHWYWTRLFLIPGFPESQSEHGFYFWVYAAGLYLSVLVSVVNYIIYYRSVPFYFRRQAVLMVLGGFIPMGVRIIEDVFGLDLVPKVDNVILFLLLSAILFALALFRFGALEIVPIAYGLVVQNINAGILVLDIFGRVVEINPFAKAMVGSQSEHAIGKSLSIVLRHWPAIGYSPQLGEKHEQEISLDSNSGVLYYLVQISPIRNDRNISVGHVVVLVDITQRKHAEMELERLARTDVLTGVTNRRHFFELAEFEYERFKRYSHPLAIMLLDVDHFKQINDNFGHLTGDYVLKQIADECRKSLRTTDIFARYGGEEFIGLLIEISQEAALETAERIRKNIEESVLEFDGQTIRVTASIGLVFAQNNVNLKLESLIDEADKALYLSKSNGRNRVTVRKFK